MLRPIAPKQPSNPPATLTGNVTTNGKRFVIATRYAPEQLAFLNGLPNSKFMKSTRQWSCQATPLAAWKLRDSGLELDGAAGALADQWDTAVAPPVRGSVDTSMLKTKPWRHQVAIAEFVANKHGALIAAGMGCVDGETEYMTPHGWKRIDEYDGEQVAQYDLEKDRIEFVDPIKYQVYDCDSAYHFKHARGLDQVLTPNHRILSFGENAYGCKPKVTTAQELIDGCNRRRFLTAAVYEGGEGIPLTDEQLRVQIAVVADGHYPQRVSSNRTTRINIKKQRKKDRLEKLLADAGIEYRKRDKEDGFSEYYFESPIRCKAFCGSWWNASLHQREIVCDEAPHWDGHTDHRPSGGVQFFSTVKSSADFVQWCFVSTGRRASMLVDNRPDKPICYTVGVVGSGRTGKYCHFALKNGNLSTVTPVNNKVYCFSVPSTFLVLRRNGNVFITGNSGKSMTSILLMTHWKCRKVLVLCPKAVMGVWRREMDVHCGMSHQSIVLDSGTSSVKADAVATAMLRSSGYATTLVAVNYDTFWRDPLFKKLASIEWDLLIADESHRCKTPSAKSSKAACEIAASSKRRLLLSGTPMPNNILDIFAQFKMIEPALFGTSFTRFRATYAVCHDQYKSKVLQLINQDDFVEKYKQLSFRVETRDVVDLPAITFTDIPVVLEPKTMKAYRTLAKQCLLELDSGEVSAQNAGVKLLRLSQLASGHIKNDDGKTLRIGGEKKQILVDLLSDIPASEPVVVFCRFIEDLRQIEEAAKETGRRYGEISGARKDLTEHAKMPANIDLMGVQEQAGGVGIDLVRACYIVDFSRGYSLGDYEQKIARVSRPGQTRPVNVYRLVSQGTVDVAVINAIQNKGDIVAEVLSHIKWRKD